MGDVNGDGKADLIYTSINNPAFGAPNWIVVQLGNGDGTLHNRIVSVTSAAYPPEIVLGDFNRDGKSDLALIDGYSNNIYVQPGNGDGTFQEGISVPLQSSPEQLIAADFNKDGKLDLAVACPFNGGQIGTYVLLGNGDGSFGTPTKDEVGGGGVAAADMNKDGAMDLVVSSDPNQDVAVLLGNGDGTFQSPISTTVTGNT